MGSASRYWWLVRLDATGKCRVEEVAIAKTFFQQQFPELLGDVSDSAIQRHLVQLWRDGDGSHSDHASGLNTSYLAECCLRCYISNQIEQVCVQLEAQFGVEHGFNRYDLLPLVLDDDGHWVNSKPNRSTPLYRSLATEILQPFDPHRAGLSTWVMRFVRHHREINRFLLGQGVYLVSDWAILNDTTPKQLQRILAEFHCQTPVEIQQAYQLLQGYHRVYRQDRLRQRQAGRQEQCQPPTPNQLKQIAHYLRQQIAQQQIAQQQIAQQPTVLQPTVLQPTVLQQQTAHPISTEAVTEKLRSLANQLRQYRIHVRGGMPPTDSLDQPEVRAVALQMYSSEEQDDQAEQHEFLVFYREQLLDCLDQTVIEVTSDRLSFLQRKSPQIADQFLQALHLFHCRGRSMSDIAVDVGLTAQYQVTRLIKLKEFRADIRQRLLLRLGDRILNQAKVYADPKRLQTLDQQLQRVLDEQIANVIQQAEAEASAPRNRPLGSLFARRLCRHLDTRITQL